MGLMNKSWLISIFLLTFVLLALLKNQEIKSMASFFRSEKTIKLTNFKKAQEEVKKEDKDLLELWESIMTGRSAPISKITKERYKVLGLNHIFTPSGFHLSAVLVPFMRIIPHQKYQFLLLMIIGVGLHFLPGLGALKRMVLIKIHQKMLGLHLGFVLALIIDILFGTFQHSPLSFTYSFLFLGIIYAGLKGIPLIVWFFLGQMLLAYFQNSDISLLLLLFSPVLNLAFAFIMPLLFLFSIPLWSWQLHSGIFVLKIVQSMVDLFAHWSMKIPSIEIHCFTMLIVVLILLSRKKLFIIGLIVFSSSLNLDRARTPGVSSKEFVPHGGIVKTTYTEKEVNVYFSDGKCRLRLVRGFWWENCSPKRRSRVRKKLANYHVFCKARESFLFANGIHEIAFNVLI